MTVAADWQFHFPTQVRFGRGVTAELGPLARAHGRSCLLVGYRDLRGLEEAWELAARSLSQAGMKVAEFREITPDPPAATMNLGAERARHAGCDVVVGLGGGSALDAAKGIAALARLGGTIWDYTKANPAARPVTAALPIVAVPTTAGTGSEATNVAVFTHAGVGPDPAVSLKAAIFGECLRPVLALLDPDLLQGSPAALMAACGIDALAHAIESLLSRRSNPMTEILARRAIELISEHLPRATAFPSPPDSDAADSRSALALGALLAGAAINVTGVTVAHVLAHGLGGVLSIPHAVAVAIATPVGLRFNWGACPERDARIAQAWRDGPASPESFVDRVTAFIAARGLPARAKASQKGSGDLVATLARNALLATPVAASMNPRPVDEAVLRELYRAVLDPPES